MRDDQLAVFIVDAFTDQLFSGNQAGIVIINEERDFPSCSYMLQVAAQLKHSETAFIKKEKENYTIRYFTPNAEVDLCGHATIAAFVVLYQEGHVEEGTYLLNTKAGELDITIKESYVWMDMAPAKLIKSLSNEEAREVYQGFGLGDESIEDNYLPRIIHTGLKDILLPVKNKKDLLHATLDRKKVVDISQKYDVVGVHIFWVNRDKSEGITAYCRNFAPLYGIDEEAATGTANGGLTYYLLLENQIQAGEINTFLQGESMGKPSVVKSIIEKSQQALSIKIGGTAIISMKGYIMQHE